MPRERSAVTVAFGTAVRALRRERGYTQETFAARAGIDRSYLGAIERGECSVSMGTILRLAAALEVTATEVLRRARL